MLKHDAQNSIEFSYLFMFISVDELDTPAYPDDFQEVKVRDNPLEYDAVSYAR